MCAGSARGAGRPQGWQHAPAPARPARESRIAMSIRTRWPWITMLLAAASALNPLGLDILHAAFFSGEQLSRNIWQPIVWVAIAIFAALIALEWTSRTFLLKRSARRPGL